MKWHAPCIYQEKEMSKYQQEGEIGSILGYPQANKSYLPIAPLFLMGLETSLPIFYPTYDPASLQAEKKS